MKKLGFTLIELLVVVAILAILILAALSMIGNRRDAATDAATKAELHRLKISFEDYYADNNCYPPASYFDASDDCNSAALSPYVKSLPCDDATGQPYVYETDSTGCGWFKLYAKLKAPHKDPEAQAQCDNTNGSSLGNYVEHSDNVAATVHCDIVYPSPSSPPVVYEPGHQYYFCSTSHNCTSITNFNIICDPTFVDDSNCGGTVGSPCGNTVSVCH